MKNQKNKYNYSTFERGVVVCYQLNPFIFLIFTDFMDRHYFQYVIVMVTFSFC